MALTPAICFNVFCRMPSLTVLTSISVPIRPCLSVDDQRRVIGVSVPPFIVPDLGLIELLARKPCLPLHRVFFQRIQILVAEIQDLSVAVLFRSTLAVDHIDHVINIFLRHEIIGIRDMKRRPRLLEGQQPVFVVIDEPRLLDRVVHVVKLDIHAESPPRMMHGEQLFILRLCRPIIVEVKRNIDLGEMLHVIPLIDHKIFLILQNQPFQILADLADMRLALPPIRLRLAVVSGKTAQHHREERKHGKNDAELKQQALPFIKFHEKRTASPAFCCNLLYFIVSYFLPLCNS